MASLSGVSSSNTLSSLMNSANMISGLASGLDTEGMIESLVKSYQAKINQLNQKVTKVEWKQDAYRSIISKMYNFSNKYASYTSATNLMSPSFFSSAVKVSALGKYADAVSASGKTSSDISLNAVHQLATSAQYRTASNMASGGGNSIKASEAIDLDGTTTLGRLNGSLTLTYGSQTVSISFDQVADVEAMNEIREKKLAAGESAADADVLAELINQKLSGQTIGLSGGESASAADRIKVTANGDRISFSDKSAGGNSVFISGASSDVALYLGISGDLKNEDKDKPKSIEVPSSLTTKVSNEDYLSGKTINVTVDGVSKSIKLPRIFSGLIQSSDGSYGAYNAENYVKALNDSLQAAFKGKVSVSNAADPDSGKLQLQFNVQEGSNLAINTSVGDTLGIGRTATSYLNTNKTLGELMGDKLEKLEPTLEKDKYGDDMYAFVINGVKVGSYSKNSTLAELMSDINKSDAGVKVSYSQTTKNFLFESKETGAGGKISLGGGLATAMFGEDHASTTKISDLLDSKEILSREFRFTIGEQTFSGSFLSDNGTMKNLVDRFNNEILKGSGYKAEYTAEKGLFFTDKNGEVKVQYENDALGAIVKASKPEDHSTDTLTSLFGGSVAAKDFSFEINGQRYEGTISSDGGRLDALVRKLNNIVKDDGYKVDYVQGRGLVVTDRGGNEVEDVTYDENDVLGKIAEKVKPEDRKYDKLVDILGAEDKKLPQSKSFDFTVNGETYTSRLDSNDATMDDLLSSINKALRTTGYTASYSSVSGDLVITDYMGRETAVEYGENSELRDILDKYSEKIREIEIAEGKKKNVYTEGQDAVFDVTVNGENIQMTRSSNSVNIDGLTITMNETFNTKVDDDGNPVDDNGVLVENGGRYTVANARESVTFKTSTDSDKIIDAIKSMVEDYNTMMAEIKSAYMTMPYQKSGGAFANYEPLTEEDMEGMSESAIARYEEKAKQGILFGDQTLSALYNKLNQAFSFSNKTDVDTLREMGITINYNVSDGAQAVTIDEDKLRAILDNDPDRVADLFTKTDGVMDRMKTQLDNYAKTTGEPKGILVQRAGTPLSSLSLLSNTWQSEIDNYTKQIEKWQDKLEAQVERYTSQFARLEQLINQMNSQSSALAGMLGG